MKLMKTLNPSRLPRFFCTIALVCLMAVCVAPARRAFAEPDVTVSISVIGPNDEVWASDQSWKIEDGSSADKVSERFFAASKLTADTQTSTYGWFLNSLSNGGDALGYDAATGNFWQLFVNGVASDAGASSVKLHGGDSLAWYYAAQGAALPEGNRQPATARPSAQPAAQEGPLAKDWIAPVIVCVAAMVVVSIFSVRRKRR